MNETTTTRYEGPVLTVEVERALCQARQTHESAVECSLDLGRSRETVQLGAEGWLWRGRTFPWPADLKPRTVYYFDGSGFAPVARFAGSLVKLVPTEWGPPTFEIDGIKMLPTARVSPYVDAERKVRLVQPRGKRVLDTCGGMGYFAAWCLALGAREIQSYEKNPEVLWMRAINPWSPPPGGALRVNRADITLALPALQAGAFDAVLHDPPRFGIAGELYSQHFYDQLYRVLRPAGVLFHYTGSPNRLTTGRDVPREVSTRLARAGFRVRREGDGLLAVKQG